MESNGEKLIALFQALEAKRAPWEEHWSGLASFIMPQKASLYTRSGAGGETPDLGAHQKLYDSTGVDANMTMARGQLAWMTPKESEWFRLEPESEDLQADEDSKNFLAHCTEAVRRMLAGSNFYAEIQETYLDRSGLGTAALHVDYSPEHRKLIFKSMPVMSYACSENAEEQVDTVGRRKMFTARQAAQFFGEDSLPPKVKERLSEDSKASEESAYIHMVFPREDYQAGAIFSHQMPIASVWVEEDSKQIVFESGYSSMPIFVTRFLRWQGVTDASMPYGYSPSWAALPDLAQLNFLGKTLQALGDRQTRPPLLIPSKLAGRVDLRPGGVTAYDEGAGSEGIPREWITQGRFDIGLELQREGREMVRRHFMVDLFQHFAQIEKQMTAREVGARQAEQVTQFSPTFDLITSELLTPLLRRCFSIALEHDHIDLNQVPQGMITSDPLTGAPMLDEPKVSFSSRLALAITDSQNESSRMAFGQALEIAQVSGRTDILDNFDMDRMARDGWRSSGGNTDHLTRFEDMLAARAARAELASQQAAMEQAA